MNCKACNQPLIEIPVNNHYRLVCDNDRCKLFREGQGIKAKKVENAPEKPEPFTYTMPMRARTKRA